MKITSEQREVLEEYFKSLGLNRRDRAMLFRYIRYGGSENQPLIILGPATTGKTTLRMILKAFGVHVHSLHESQYVTLKKPIALNEESAQYIREIVDKLGVSETCCISTYK